MGDLFLSTITAKRLPNPDGRAIIVEPASLAGLPEGGGASGIRGTGTTVTSLGSWSSIEGISVTSLGQLAVLDSGAKDYAVIYTTHAPLTKGYGDAQLAGIDDVNVYVDGVPASVLAIEPVVGIIVLDQDINVIRNREVLIEYVYTQNPTLEMACLNDAVYLLNQYNERTLMPFTYNTVLAPYDRPQPQQFEHRYRAFDYEYTSIINDPTSMLLNEPRHQLTLPKFSRTNTDLSVFFEGDDHPTDFEFIGPALGPATFEQGLYVIEDISSSVDVISSQPAMFRSTVDLTFEHDSILNFRTQITDWDSNGDFTGVAAGFADDDNMYLVGFLDISGFKTVSLLEDPDDEHDWRSWAQLEATAVDNNGTVDLLEFTGLPPLAVGQSLFIDGEVYEVVDIDPSQTDASVYEVFLDTEVTSGEGTVQLFPEIDWTILNTYRVFRNDDGSVDLFIGGSVIPHTSTSNPALAVEIFEVTLNNTLFFGSVDRKASNRSLWDFVRYSLLPSQRVEQDSEVSVDAEFNVLPDDDPNDPWYLTDNQGYSKIQSNEFLLTQSAGQPVVGGAVSYTRLEPFLTSKARVDLTTSLRVHSYSNGIPAFLTIADDKKEVTLGLFEESLATFQTFESLSKHTLGHWAKTNAASLQTRGHLSGVNPPAVDQFLAAFGGVQTFADAPNWTSSFDDDELTFYDHFMRVQHDGVAASSEQESTGTGDFTNEIAGARVRMGDYTTLTSGQVPLYFGVSDGNDEIYLTLFDDGSTKRVVFCDEDGTLVFSGPDPLGFDFDWDDGEFHHYKINRNLDNVTVFIDGVYQALFDVADLPVSMRSDPLTKFGLRDGQVDFDLDYFFAHSAIHGDRRLGVYTGGDLLDPANYEFIDKEWLGSFVDIRVARYPTGKTSVFVDGSLEFEFQYSELPDRTERFNVSEKLGFVQFGTLDPQAYSEVMWDYVRYNIVNQREVQKANNNSYLNRHNVISSPEPVLDVDPETVTIDSTTSNLIRLSETGMYAERILSVTSEDGLSTYPFSYDADTNEIAITGAGLPSENETVVVTFYHRKPYTEAYLENNFAFTRLNEGTPPVPLSQQVELQASEAFQSQLNNPDDVLNTDVDFALNDGRRVISFTKNDEAFYSCLKVLTTETDVSSPLADISPACDENGLRTISFDGPFSEEEVDLPAQGDENTSHNYRILYLNNPDTVQNSPEGNTALLESPVSMNIAPTEEEIYDAQTAVTDAVQTGAPDSVLSDFYGSGLLNNPLATASRVNTSTGDPVHSSSVILTANTVTSTDYPLDFTSSVLFP